MQDNKKFKLVSVLLSGPFDKVFSYKINISSYEVGKIIIAPFRNQKLLGIILDEDPVIAARMLCDRHIPKMIVESAQMLSTAHRLLDGSPTKRRSRSGKTIQTYYEFKDMRDELYYTAVHKHHPCTTWTMASIENYNWHYGHFAEMSKEFTFRR